MSVSLIEDFRSKVVGDLFELESVSSVWDQARVALRAQMPSTAITPQDVTNLGLHLSTTFKSLYTAVTVTTQADEQALASRAGALWEALIVWYINLCLAGTNAVAIKKRSHMPDSIKDALTVWLNHSEKLSEPDAVILHFNAPKLAEPYSGSVVKAYSTVADENFKEISVVNIQCKTNWNDAVQTPMLWNLLYAAARQSTGEASMKVLGATSVTFGSSGHYIQGLSAFRHAFITMPSNKLENFTPTSTPVIRGKAFTGGCFWGYPSSSGICRSIAEFFNVNSALLPDLTTIGKATATSLNGAHSDGIQLAAFRF